ncbi:hypothetical protein FQN60_011892 [Etheostoma spectabile]|uniref:N-acyl-aromatic-L-amino acid amidohydrolase n=1 Tax=Etheostoma spectabile TaxID=54343 RepID=A0A5J5DMS5_9PERO|nr:hypothetical protein FQN60_011892 [Etheostoma spectabile]
MPLPPKIKGCLSLVSDEQGYLKEGAPITDSTPYEVRRAQELNAQLGPKGTPEAVDLLCDLHNTTANMGMCLIFYSFDWIALHIYNYIQSKMTSAPVTAIQMDISETYSLESVGKHGIAIEVGPQPHGVTRADIFNLMKEAVDLTIECLQKLNSGKKHVLVFCEDTVLPRKHVKAICNCYCTLPTGSTFEGGKVEAYTLVKSVDYPRDPTTNNITAAIHPQLQDNDFKLLKPGDPIFLSFSGETVKHEGEELYPVFVNECAYYEKKIAFHLAKKVTVTFPSVSVKKVD